MAKNHTISTLTLEPRTGIGTTAANALRRAGKIPGVVYGHGESTPITVDAKQLADLVHSGNKSRIVDAKVGDKHDSVLLRRIEAHPISRKPLSVDFQRVSQDEAVTATVTVVTVGTPVGVRDQGGVMDIIAHTLEIKGPSRSIPDNVTVDVSELSVHEHVVASQIALPEGWMLLTSPDQTVISVEITRASAGEEAPAGEELPAEAAPPTAS